MSKAGQFAAPGDHRVWGTAVDALPLGFDFVPKKCPICYFCAHKCSRTENFKGDSVLFTSDVDLWQDCGGGAVRKWKEQNHSYLH